MTNVKTCTNNQSNINSKEQLHQQENLDHRELSERMSQIKHKIIVLSGKGGVGKSTVAANLAMALSLNDNRVGLLDIDIHGPSIPKLLKLEGRPLGMKEDKMIPVSLSKNLQVMSIGFLLQHKDDAVIWRGPMKYNVIKQFLQDVEWGNLGFLVVDSPPGTGDEPLTVCQLISDADGAIVVTTPQEVALADVRKSIDFCRKLKLPILGVVENMSGFICPHCGKVTDIFKSGGGEHMAQEMAVPFLGRIPVDPLIAQSCDEGKPFIDHYSKTPATKKFKEILQKIMAWKDRQGEEQNSDHA
jgi:ATP-binding protein involved in chromosome partitioning